MFQGRKTGLPLAFLMFALALLHTPILSAQTRLSDSDLEQRMKNLKNDTNRFKSSFNNTIGKSIIRKTSQEKDAKKLAQTFESQVEQLLNAFKRTKKSDPYLQTCLESARQLDRTIQDAQLTGVTLEQWSKVKTELSEIAQAFDLPAL